MIVDVNEIKSLLDDDSISAYKIRQKTGISETAINGYRRGERKFDNFNVKTIKKLQQYIDRQKHNQK